MPMPLHLSEDRYRVYFGTRDESNRPHVGFVEIDLGDPTEVLEVSSKPALAPGQWGCFDDNGVYPGTLIRTGDTVRMYYAGRSNGEGPLFYMAIGVAESDDGGRTFRRLSSAPIMARSEHDPWMVSTPCVRREQRRWRMWYLSGLGWLSINPIPRSRYHIKYSESADGLNWRRDGTVAIPLVDDESNISAPTVLADGDAYRMWYSYVNNSGSYRIGYAESADGVAWKRNDENAGIEPSANGWDSKSIAYPSVFEHGEQRYLLYSGNGNGREGIGIAASA